MRVETVISLVILLVIANGSPALFGILLRERLDWPVDGGRKFIDGRRLFGASKTLRGLLAAIIITALVAPLLGLGAVEGALFGLLAMAGDLGSSFIKRRLDYAPGCACMLLDQLPEACLPLWALSPLLGASLWEMAVAVLLFTVIDLLLSRLYKPDQTECR